MTLNVETGDTKRFHRAIANSHQYQVSPVLEIVELIAKDALMDVIGIHN